MKYQAVIFDMDGVLIDSDLHWLEAEMEYLKKYNVIVTPDITSQMAGRSLRDSVALVKEMYNLSQSVEELLREKTEASNAIYTHKAQAMPGVETLLQKLQQVKARTAIASGSFLQRIEMIVDRFAWREYFEHLVSSDHVNYVGKPDPAIYRYTAQKLGLDPANCVVIEDSVNGLVAAKGAGMSCIAVPDARWSRGDYSAADLIANGLTDTKVVDFLGLP
jgi:sugar-phosphatase